MVVKSKVLFELVGDLKNIFEIMRKHKLCLNASKCSFVWDRVNLWDIWSLIVELRSTLIRLRQLAVYSHLKIPKKSKN